MPRLRNKKPIIFRNTDTIYSQEAARLSVLPKALQLWSKNVNPATQTVLFVNKATPFFVSLAQITESYNRH